MQPSGELQLPPHGWTHKEPMRQANPSEPEPLSPQARATKDRSSPVSNPSQLPDHVKPVLVLLATVVFIAVVNGTMINVALPYIGREFDVTEATYGWLVTGYSLSFGIFNAINGKLSDRFGKKNIYMIGLAVLGLGSIAVALTPSIGIGIAIRLVQGAGAAALPVLGTSIIKQVVPAHQQGKAVGIILSTVGVAASIGPFLGGIIVQFLSWRHVFAATGLSLLALPLAYKLLPEELNEKGNASLDGPGALLLALGVSTLLYGFELFQSQAALWKMAALLGTSIFLLVAFAWRITHAKEPFISPKVFKKVSYISCCLVAASSNAARFGSVVIAPIVLTDLMHQSPLIVGATLFPGAVGIALLSSRAGEWADRNGPRSPASVGLLAITTGSVVMALSMGSSVWGMAAGLTLLGIGYALAQSPLVSTVNRILPAKLAGAGVGMFMMIFFVGGAAGVAACVTMSDMLHFDEALFSGLVSPRAAPFAAASLLLAAISLLAQIPARSLPTSSAT